MQNETTAIVDSTTGIDATRAKELPKVRSVETGRLVECVICLHDRVAWQPDVHLRKSINRKKLEKKKNEKKLKWKANRKVDV